MGGENGPGNTLVYSKEEIGQEWIWTTIGLPGSQWVQSLLYASVMREVKERARKEWKKAKSLNSWKIRKQE